jgi:hypothetical protein
MDFIERVFGMAPDGGSGLLEAALFNVPILGLVLLRGAHSGRGGGARRSARPDRRTRRG